MKRLPVGPRASDRSRREAGREGKTVPRVNFRDRPNRPPPSGPALETKESAFARNLDVQRKAEDTRDSELTGYRWTLLGVMGAEQGFFLQVSLFRFRICLGLTVLTGTLQGKVTR